MKLKGIDVILLERTPTGTDPFGKTTYVETGVTVENVLIAPVDGQEVVDTLDLTGRKAVYQLAVPKGDTHNWENRRVQFFGQTWRTIGKPIRGIEELIPGPWNMKVKVESCDE